LFEVAVNRTLRLDPEGMQRLGELQDKVILLEVVAEAAVPLRLYVIPTEDGVRMRREYEQPADVTISGTATVFLNQFFRGPTVSDALTIRGDIELGQRFQRVLSHLDPDWEEGLARVVGDIPAHQLARFGRGVLRWAREAVRTFALDGTEYLKEEVFVLAKRERVEQFLREVDRLRADADRLEKRFARLTGAP